MSFHFRPAVREHARLLIGLNGPSGSGKTMSALRLATGLGGKIALIDTESGRAAMYADSFTFLHADLQPPFSPDRYRQILDEAAKTAPDVIIVDSMSHVWEADGGVLHQVDQARGTAKNDFAIWAKPKLAHQRMIGRLLQMQAHVICCFRAKEKRGLAPDPDRPGKQMIVDLGWAPICEAGVPFEMTINLLLGPGGKGLPVVDTFEYGKLPAPMAGLLPSDEQISEETGRRLAAWASGGTEGSASKGQPAAMVTTNEPDQVITVIYDEHDVDDREEALSPKDAAEKLAKRLKATSYFYGSRMLGHNLSWIGALDKKWQDRLQSIVAEKQSEADEEGSLLGGGKAA